MNAIRLHPEEKQQTYTLNILRLDAEEGDVAVELSSHDERRAALDALYDRIQLLVRHGFTCERENILRWKAQRRDPDKLISCVVYITEIAAL